MAAPVRIARRERRAGIGVYDDLGESRAVAFFRRFLVVMADIVMIMPVTAGFSDVGGESDRGCDCGKPEKTNPQLKRGYQAGPKHALSRPIFCLDHWFVRPNYAQRPVTLPCSETDCEA